MPETQQCLLREFHRPRVRLTPVHRLHRHHQIPFSELEIVKRRGTVGIQINAEKSCMLIRSFVSRHSGRAMQTNRVSPVAFCPRNRSSDRTAANIAHTDKHQPIDPVPVNIAILAENTGPHQGAIYPVEDKTATAAVVISPISIPKGQHVSTPVRCRLSYIKA